MSRRDPWAFSRKVKALEPKREPVQAPPERPNVRAVRQALLAEIAQRERAEPSLVKRGWFAVPRVGGAAVVTLIGADNAKVVTLAVRDGRVRILEGRRLGPECTVSEAIRRILPSYAASGSSGK